MKKIAIQLVILISLLALLVLPYLVFAQDPALDRLKTVGPAGGYAEAKEDSVAKITGTVIRAFLSLLGVIFIILIVYAGYHWMTAAGDEQKVQKAKDTIQRAIIGLIIVLAAFAITWYVTIKIASQ